MLPAELSSCFISDLFLGKLQRVAATTATMVAVAIAEAVLVVAVIYSRSNRRSSSSGGISSRSSSMSYIEIYNVMERIK